MFASAGFPVKAPIIRRSESAPKYHEIFRGSRPIDNGRLAQIATVEQYLPLFDALRAKPSQAEQLKDTPFIWTCNNVEYSSSCCAFDRNMWVASSIGEHWNSIKLDDAPQQINAKHVVPVVQGCNFLLEGGLDEDMTRPMGKEEELLPPLLQRARITAMRKAGLAVAWKNAADSVDVEGDNDTPANYNVKGKMLLESARQAQDASPFLKQAFVKSREIEAGAMMANKWKAESEDTPTENFSIKAYKLFAAVGSEIGLGLMHAARIKKCDAQRNAEVCAGDLVEVHSIKEDALPALLKKESLKKLLGEETTLQGDIAPLDWMKIADPCCFKEDSRILLA